MASQGPDAFYAALRAKPDNPIKFGKEQAVVLTPSGQDDQTLQLPNDGEAAKLLKVADDGAPYPAPASTRPSAGVVYSAAAEVVPFWNLPWVHNFAVKYKPELKHTKWEFPSNAPGADTAGEAAVISPTLSESEWGDSIKADLQKYSGPGVARLLVFVHGYNTLPKEANETAHRILQPVGANGGLGVQAVVSFTWDSKGRTLSYLHEEHMAESDSLSTHLADLIRRLLLIKLDKGKHWQLVILAHSMGNRPTTFALGKVYKDAEGKAALQRNTADLPMLVINAAADIDASTYSHTMEPVMTLLEKSARAIVLDSTHDIPLILSYLVHDRPNQEHGKEERTGLLFTGLDQAWQEKFIEYKVGRAAANTGLFGALDPDEPRLAPVIKVPYLDVIDCSAASQEQIANNGNGHGYFMTVESVRAEIVAAMDTPDTAKRLQKYSKEQHARIAKAPAGNPLPFVLYDGPLYKIQ